MKSWPVLLAAAVPSLLLVPWGRGGTAPPAPRPSPQRPTPAPTPTPLPGQIRVVVTVVTGGRSAAAGDAVVWIPGSTEAGPLPRGKITSRKKRFNPRVTAIPAGGTIDFPNLDRIHHNVFSLSERARFDLGLYKNGASKPWTFERPGLVRIYCNIHPQMAGFVMVLDGQRYAETGRDGLALLEGVPPGPTPLKVWDEHGGEWSGTVIVESGRTVPVTVRLDASGFQEAPHTRKDGTKYPPPDDDDNRY